MTVFFLIMYLLALICFLLAAFGNWSVPHVNIGFLGLAFFVVPPLVQTIQAVP